MNKKFLQFVKPIIFNKRNSITTKILVGNITKWKKSNIQKKDKKWTIYPIKKSVKAILTEEIFTKEIAECALNFERKRC